MAAPRQRTAPTIFDVVSDRATTRAGEPSAPVEPSRPLDLEDTVEDAPPAVPAPAKRAARNRAPRKRVAKKAAAVAPVPEPAPTPARSPAPTLLSAAGPASVAPSTVALITQAPTASASPEVTDSEAATARTLDRRTSRRGQARPGRLIVGQTIAGLCLLAAVVLVVSALLLFAQANEDNGLVTFVSGLADRLDLGVFDVDNGVMKFAGDRADLKNALFNRGVCALVWVLVGKVAQRVIGDSGR